MGNATDSIILLIFDVTALLLVRFNVFTFNFHRNQRKRNLSLKVFNLVYLQILTFKFRRSVVAAALKLARVRGGSSSSLPTKMNI